VVLTRSHRLGHARILAGSVVLPLCACALLLSSSAAEAKGGANAIVLHAVTPLAECSTCPPLHRPEADVERDLAAAGRQLDGVVVDAAQDLGLSVDVSARPPGTESPAEQTLVERAEAGWVFSPRIAMDRGLLVIRIVAVAPGSKVVLARTETTKLSELEVRVVTMMRDLVGVASRPAAASVSEGPSEPAPVVHATRSSGRAILALNAAVFGGYVGYSLQRATGSNDARLTYPLVALGAGIGLGGSMIIADEWDIGVGDAWYLAAGMAWPAIGALLVADSYRESDNRFLYSAGAAAGGLALATTSLSFGSVGEGGALIAHSGGAFGTVLGGIGQLAFDGRTDETPTRGMGIGAITGVVLTGALARFYPAEAASRVLLVDLAVGLGGLTGAAVGSPLVFGEDVGATRNRLWLSTIAIGMVGGAAVGLLLMPSAAPKAHADVDLEPTAGVIATESDPDGSSRPITGMGVRGAW
jgi:hypothetical protein